ncbi:MAG TPA: hypothetical protein VK326_11105 [Solirubrobacterales bacterium]|nr:hypothetical protein [Solirubrobacterales bacterium]
MFIKLLLTALAALAVGGATIVLADSGEPDVGLRSTTTTAEDVSGPCDEAEHASDPRCAGDAAGIDDDRGRDHPEDDAIDDDDGVIEDISGPCDEAEHAADPECTGVVATAPAVDDDDDAADDNSGPGSTSSGPGGPGDDGGDSSGPGGGGD